MSNFLTQNDSGSGLPYIQWGSDAVQWSKKQGDGKVNFTFSNAIFDMENLKLGWIKIAVGEYDAVLSPYQDGAPDRPAGTTTNQRGDTVPSYNKGFGVNVLFGKEFGDERLFSFSTSQKGSLEAVGGLLSQYEAEKSANAGKVPVVSFTGHTNKKFGKGSSNIPNLSITSWVDRPVELDAEHVASNEVAAPAQAVSEF